MISRMRFSASGANKGSRLLGIDDESVVIFFEAGGCSQSKKLIKDGSDEIGMFPT